MERFNCEMSNLDLEQLDSILVQVKKEEDEEDAIVVEAPKEMSEAHATLRKKIEERIASIPILPERCSLIDKMQIQGLFNKETKTFTSTNMQHIITTLNDASTILKDGNNVKLMNLEGYDEFLYDLHLEYFDYIMQRVKVTKEDTFVVYVIRTSKVAINNGVPYRLYIGSTVHNCAHRFSQHRGITNSGAPLLEKFITDHNFESLEKFVLVKTDKHLDILRFYECILQRSLNTTRCLHGLNITLGITALNDDVHWGNKLLELIDFFFFNDRLPKRFYQNENTLHRGWKYTREMCQAGSLTKFRHDIVDLISPIITPKRDKSSISSRLNKIEAFYKEHGRLPPFGAQGVEWKDRSDAELYESKIRSYITCFRYGHMNISDADRARIMESNILRPILDKEPKWKAKFEKSAIKFISTFVDPFRNDSVTLPPQSKMMKSCFFKKLCIGCSRWTEDHKEILKALSFSKSNTAYMEIIPLIDEGRTPKRLQSAKNDQKRNSAAVKKRLDEARSEARERKKVKVDESIKTIINVL